MAQVVVAALVTYMVVLNVFLLTPLLRRITNTAGRAFQLEYVRGYALVPWRVHAKGLRIHAADSHVEWALTIDEVAFGIHLFPLFKRQFKATNIQADGVTFRVRMLESVPSPLHEERLPEILGFGDPPLKPMLPEKPPKDDKYRLFTVDLEGVDAQHVREVWVDTMRFAGDLRVRGRWGFEPLRHIEIGPATVDVSTLDVSPGLDEPFVRGASGTLGVTVHPYDMKGPILRYVSAHANLTGSLRVPDGWRELAPASWGVAGPAGDGVFAVDVIVDDGVVQPESLAKLDVPELELSRAGFGGQASVSVRASVGEANGATTGRVDLAVRDVLVGRAPSVQARVEAMRVTLTTPDVDLVSPLSEVAYDVKVTGATAPRMDPLTPFLPKGVSLTSGPCRAHGHVAGSLTKETAKGEVSFAVDQAVLVSPIARMSGNVSLDVVADRAVGSTLTQLGGTRLSLDHVRTPGADGWWARVTLAKGAIEDTAAGFRGRVQVHLDARDATPMIPIVAKVSGAPAWIVGLVSMPNLRGDGEVTFAPGLLDVRGVNVRGGQSSVRVELADRATSNQGLVLAQAGPLSAGFGLGSETPKVVLVDAAGWFESKRGALPARSARP